MDWSAHAIWWHVYPLGFVGAERVALPEPAQVVHRLPRLEDWLDYLVELGCNGLALGPVFVSDTHGYDTVDHYRIDPRLGSEDDLLHLVGQAKARGVHVLLDGVFNHVGRGFFAFADVAAHGSRSRYARWFRAAEGGAGYETFEGHDRLVALNHENPEVADYVTDVMTYWLERGVAGWRLDAAYAVPLAFWRTVTDRVRQRFPDAWLVGEVIHGDYTSYVTDAGLDSVTQYELWKALWSSLNDRNFFELAHALERHNACLESFAPLTFVGNHDVTRIASQLHDERTLEHALVVLFTVGGVPAVYAGDEQAFRGVKEHREGGDDAIRPAFPDHPHQLAGEGWATYRLHQQLIAFRRRHPWLVRAETTTTSLTNTAAVYTASDGTHTVVVALNVDDEPARLPLPGPPGGSWQPAVGAADLDAGTVTVPAAGWTILTSASAHE